MIIKTFKNIAIITLDLDDLYYNTTQEKEELIGTIDDLISSKMLDTKYKIHLFVNETKCVDKHDMLEIIDKFNKYGNKLYIHSFCSNSIIPKADKVHLQEYNMGENMFIKVTKKHNKIIMTKYTKTK